jgi:hypothetical protein
MPKIIVFLILPLLLIFACEPCGKGYNPQRELAGLSILSSNSNGALLNADSIFIQRDTAYFKIQFDVRRFAATSHSFGFISAATACDLPAPYLIHSIDSMAVITVDLWDAGHPPMSSISDLVTAKQYWGFKGSVDTTFKQYSKTLKSQSGFYDYTHWFGIHSLPASRKGRFYIWIRLSNGLELKSNVLKLNG